MANEYDYLRTALFVLGFILTATRGLQTWLIADMVFTAISGLGLLLFPASTIQLQTSGVEVDALHRYLNRCFGCFLLGPLLMWLYCRKVNDETVKGSLLWSRVMSIPLLLICMGYVHTISGSHFTEKHLWFGFLGNALWWLANVIQLVKLRPSMGRSDRHGPISTVLRILFFISFIWALTDIAFPDMILNFKSIKLDQVHLHTIRAVGCLMMGTSVFFRYAPYYRRDEDRRVLFCSTLLTLGLVLGCLQYAVIVDEMLTKEVLQKRLVIFIPAILPLIGLFMTRKARTPDQSHDYGKRKVMTENMNDSFKEKSN